MSLIVEQGVRRCKYVFGEKTGDFYTSQSTTLESAAHAIATHFKQDPKFFHSTLNGQTYTVCERDAIVPLSTVCTFASWASEIGGSYLVDKFSYIKQRLPESMEALLFPGIIYSPLIVDRIYYGLPKDVVRIKEGNIHCLDFLFRALRILQKGGIRKVNVAGLYARGEDCGFTPASVELSSSELSSTPCSKESINALINIFKKSKDFSPYYLQKCNNILSGNEEPTLPYESKVNLQTRLLSLSTDQYSNVASIVVRNHPNVKDLDEVDIELISYAAIKEIHEYVGSLPDPAEPKGPAEPAEPKGPAEHKSKRSREGPKTHEELKELAKKTKLGTVNALGVLTDELKRMSGKVVDTDHPVMKDYGTEYKL